MKKLVFSSLLFLLVIAAIFATLIAVSNVPLPSKTSSPSLTIPKRPKTSRVMLTWLKKSKLSKLATKGSRGPVWRRMVDDLTAGRLLSQPKRVGALFKTLEPQLMDLAKATLSKGCIPSQDYKQVNEPAEFSYIPWIYGMRGLMAKLRLEMRAGGEREKARKAAAHLLKLQEKLYFYEQTCGANLIGTMVMVVAVRPVMLALAALLKHPEIPVATKKKAALWLRKWATRKESISVAFRWEARFLLRVMDQIKLGKKPVMGRKIPLKYAWPFYDGKETKYIATEIWRCVLRRNQLPIHLQETYPLCPIERYLRELKAQPTWKKSFRYNSVGKILLSIATPSYRRFAAKMQQSICFSAAVHTQWQRSLTAQERSLFAPSLLKEVLNPLTGRTFPKLGSKACGAPKGWKTSLFSLSLPELPKTLVVKTPAVKAPATP
jgi:hypothetical protein